MPINEPIQNRKVAPASLAFEGKDAARGAIFQVGTTPTGPTIQEIVNNYNFNFALTLITNQQLEANTDTIMKAMNNSEARAKESVGGYKNVLQWDLQQDQVYLLGGGIQNIAYNTEIIRTPGARSYGTPANNTARWYFTCPEDAAGVWWFHVQLNIRHTIQDGVRAGYLIFLINDTIWRIVDQVDNNMMGETQITDMRLAGGCHVPLEAGFRFSVGYLIDTNGAGFNTAVWPSSLYSYVTGHRETCEADVISMRDSGMSYQFYHQ